MNAYELAKYIEDDIQIQEGIADMLREQADRIAELEKQTKPLSDEEILNLYKETGADNGGIREFVRAIEERHGIK